MKLPRLARSRRKPDGWLVRVSARLSEGDTARLGPQADTVRAALAERIGQAVKADLQSGVQARDEYLLVIRPGRRKSDSDDPVPVVRNLLNRLGEPVPSPVGPVFPRLNAAFTQTACLATDGTARDALSNGLREAEKAGSGVAIAVDLSGDQTRLLTLDTPETEMVSVLKRAIDSDNVIMHYQPVVRLSDGRITAFEALMRIADENGGDLLSPSQFIGVAERSGLIHELGRVALSAAAAQMKAWREEFGARAPQRIAVNVAPPQFENADFVAEVEAAFADVGLSALTLELTETALVHEMPQACAALDALRAGGAWVALDDFGVEYSNLSYLRDLAIDIVKIDRSFLDAGPHEARAVTILTKVVELAHLLDARVVAEGVAGAEQVVALKKIGIDYGQGSQFGLAMDFREASLRIVAQAVPPSAESSSGEMPSFDKA